MPSAEMCGASNEQALVYLTRLEQLTKPRASEAASQA
jgi:hypothetical protein